MISHHGCVEYQLFECNLHYFSSWTCKAIVHGCIFYFRWSCHRVTEECFEQCDLVRRNNQTLHVNDGPAAVNTGKGIPSSRASSELKNVCHWLFCISVTDCYLSVFFLSSVSWIGSFICRLWLKAVCPNLGAPRTWCSGYEFGAAYSICSFSHGWNQSIIAQGCLETLHA